MKQTQQTPGPWKAYCGKTFTRVHRWSQGRDDKTGTVQICHIAGSEDADLRPFNKDRWEADARLIAAAPDLLEAVLIALPYVEDALDDEVFKPGAVKKHVAILRAAIAKAEERR